MMTGPRGRGRKANGYVSVKTMQDVKLMVIDDFLHHDKGVSRGRGEI
jgi:hypothetical protein